MVLRDYADFTKERGFSVKIERFSIGKLETDAIQATRAAIGSNTLAGVGLVTSKYANLGAPQLVGSNYTVVSPYATASHL